jgi:hypothetical protein
MSEWQPSKKQFRDEATCRIRLVMKEVREAISKVLDLKLSPPSSKKANSPMTETVHGGDLVCLRFGGNGVYLP